jgi:hypothetical protein
MLASSLIEEEFRVTTNERIIRLIQELLEKLLRCFLRENYVPIVSFRQRNCIQQFKDSLTA